MINGIIVAIKTGIKQLLVEFPIKIKLIVGPNRKLKPKATPIKPNVFALDSGV